MRQLKEAYERRFDAALKPLASAIREQLEMYFAGEPRIDRITARAKSVDRFFSKAQTVENGALKYSDPIHQIQDQIGARIVTYYLSDVDRVAKIVEKYYRPIESQILVPDSEWEFGYFGRHYVLLIPSDVVDRSVDKSLRPAFFELQVKTLFQHAWSEANHDLGYKPRSVSLDPGEKRLLAYTSAQAWGADRVFDELSRGNSN